MSETEALRRQVVSLTEALAATLRTLHRSPSLDEPTHDSLSKLLHDKVESIREQQR